MSDARIKRDINRLVEPARPDRVLPEAEDVVPIGPGIGVARPVIRGSAGGGGGIVSPLTEPNAETREYHTIRYVYTTGGVIAFARRPIKTVDMVDGAGNALVMIYADPS